MKIKYPAEQAVSIWVGSFPTEDDFDHSVEEDIAKRLGLKTPIQSICEVAFEDDCVGLRELFEGFSGWETFVEGAINAAKKQGLETANAALVCYYLKCEDSPSKWGTLYFLGSFSGQDVADSSG